MPCLQPSEHPFACMQTLNKPTPIGVPTYLLGDISRGRLPQSSGLCALQRDDEPNPLFGESGMLCQECCSCNCAALAHWGCWLLLAGLAA
eukprot:scaffold183413_cov18-Tisochrysis_lutea.AAC.3